MAKKMFLSYGKGMIDHLKNAASFSETAAIILAAGHGTRMKSSLSKLLHPVAGLSMLQHVLRAAESAGCKDICVVTAPAMDTVRSAVAPYTTAIQPEALGTGHAVLSAKSFLEQHAHQNILILYGDTPLITPETLGKLLEKQQGATIALLGMRPQDPTHYGRIFCDTQGNAVSIIEHKDATLDQRQNNLCWGGVMVVQGARLLELLSNLTNDNVQQEYYLPQIISLAHEKGLTTAVLETSEDEVRGVNSQFELAQIEYIYQQRKRKYFMDQGVTMQDPHSVYFSYDSDIKNNVRIEPHVFIGPGVKVESDVTIKAFSYLEGCHLHSHVSVGPYARIRPGTVLHAHAKVGNFVEIKNSELGEHSKVSHLSYIGDSTLEDHVNVGAGTITCNYDGVHKSRTHIGANTFIGSNTSLVAPLTIGKNTIVAAGSVVTENVEDDALAVGRSRQQTIAHGAQKIWERKKKKDS